MPAPLSGPSNEEVETWSEIGGPKSRISPQQLNAIRALFTREQIEQLERACERCLVELNELIVAAMMDSAAEFKATGQLSFGSWRSTAKSRLSGSRLPRNALLANSLPAEVGTHLFANLGRAAQFENWPFATHFYRESQWLGFVDAARVLGTTRYL